MQVASQDVLRTNQPFAPLGCCQLRSPPVGAPLALLAVISRLGTQPSQLRGSPYAKPRQES